MGSHKDMFLLRGTRRGSASHRRAECEVMELIVTLHFDGANSSAIEETAKWASSWSLSS
eukprot:CAMPEP_0175168682 /NCGR_PEP_ID=MMETSP0087-20121206/29103_1 /TAXON_ID=136419 /ORGANISM="Unknown Unknown, Strain D1" /LENGTH=58 /DNA_ID=CAMNT_0016458849 /DNA_START=257 /DNA_END=430 /DNA_ORIENTATION=+